MEKIGAYELLEKITETRHAIVYRGRSETGTAIIKSLKVESSSASEKARFRQEYELIRNIHLDGIVACFDMVDDGNRIAIILEDFNGISLKEYLGKKSMDIPGFLVFGVQLARSLGDLHLHNIVHRDIKPQNIIVAPDRNVKITDFGISSEITHENDDLYNPSIIEGTLSYMSPEQTGRMNRPIDYRTDLYSLGITFYEMLTGDIPFKSKDPMEIIHSHLARQAPHPMEIRSSIPPALSAIVMKLMAKTAEERYQNCHGLMHDLQKCQELIDAEGKISDFALGTKDISLKFNIPQQLIGREDEVTRLLSAFDRVCAASEMKEAKGVEMMLVLGHPGIGKSALINEIQKPVAARRGYFITGKYDQFRKDVPYSAIIQGFMGLVTQILTESDVMIRQWKTKLLDALGPNGSVITNVIPSVAHVIGEQPAVPDLGPEEAQNRFNMTFKNFVEAFTSSGRPLVLFLDDLQWADLASLKLINLLAVDADLRNMLLIGAYRDNEVHETHPLSTTLEEIKKSGTLMQSLNLSPLPIEDINRLISNFLRFTPEKTHELASIVFEKTGGNPFFINQFLKTLYDNRHLVLDPEQGWRWDIHGIKAMQVTDNVVDLMAQKITGLPKSTRDILTTCACIGNRFDLETLAVILNTSIDAVLGEITGAIEEGLIHRTGDIYRFHHDRIQEAAYSLLSENEKSRLHYQIGTYVLENTPADKLNEKVLFIVNHLNRAQELFTEGPNRIRLVELNLMAGRKGIRTSAYDSAYSYAKEALGLLPEDAWKIHEALTLNVYCLAAQASYLSTDFDAADDYIATAMKHTRDIVKSIPLYVIKIQATFVRKKAYEATKVAIEASHKLGFSFSEKPSILEMLWEYFKVKARLLFINFDDLKHLPDISNPREKALAVMYSAGSPALFLGIPKAVPYAALKTLHLILRFGNYPGVAHAYSISALVISGGFNDFKTGCKLGEMAEYMLENYYSGEFRSRVECMLSCFTRHLQEPVRDTLPRLKLAYQYGLETGDFEHATMAHMVASVHGFFAGRNLEELNDDLLKSVAILERLKQLMYKGIILLFLQTVHNLRGTAGDASVLKGPYCDESTNELLNSFVYYKSLLLYYFGMHEQAGELMHKTHRYFRSMIGTFYIPVFFFFESLNLIALCRMFPRKKKKLLKKARKKLKKLRRWSDQAPMNHKHRVLLISAEIARLEKKDPAAIRLYEQSVVSARDNGFIQDEALANELASLFWLSYGNISVASTYMTAARACYARWGAAAKVEYLEKLYPNLIDELRTAGPREISDTISGTTSYGTTNHTTNGTSALDLQSIMSSSRTIASEMNLENLLKKSMKIALENSGAQKGFFLLKNEQTGKLHIEAEAGTDGTITALQSIPLDECKTISRGIINYVVTTGENLILNDVSGDTRFNADPHIVSNNVKSVLCSPIRHKGNSAGIIYLENSLATNVFTPERLQLLQIFSSQAAISLENARLLVHRENAAKLETEMKIAANIQLSLLPRKPSIPGYQITGFMKPADDVGGDYYDVINTEKNPWVIIGDVSGHGVPAGLVMMMVQTCIQMALRNSPDITPSQLLHAVDKAVSYNIEQLNESKYMTITVFSVGDNGRFTFSGLHQNILVYRAATASVETIESCGIWLGLLHFSMKAEEGSLTLLPGDTCLFYTDGITECHHKEFGMFGEEGLTGVLEKTGSRGTDAIRDAILAAIEGYITNDDVTMLIIKRD